MREEIMGEIRALTVRQPWAHMITYCGKSIENRSWPTRYRGMLAVHAGARSGWDSDGQDSPLVQQAWSAWANSAPALADGTIPLSRNTTSVTFSAVIAVARITGCHRAIGAAACSCSPWSQADQWHWELSNVRALDSPVPCRGSLGLWRLPEDAQTAVRDQFNDSAGG